MRQLRVDVHTLADTREARRVAARVASQTTMSSERLAELEIVTAELATNLARHAQQGVLFIRHMAPLRDAVEIVSLDAGPGIADVNASFVDGFSTAGTAGTGLGAVKRLATQVSVDTSASGTSIVALMDFAAESAPPHRLSLGGISIPRGGETTCGDAWAWYAAGEGIRLVVLDGLGHGPRASEASETALSAVEEEPRSAPPQLLKRMHVALRSTRGAAAAIVDVVPGAVTFTGVGNIAARVLLDDGSSRGLVCLSGTVGAALPRIRSFEAPLSRGDQLIVHSDGISSRWPNDAIAQHRNQPAALAAAALFRRSSRERDDATVVIVRCEGKA